MSALLNAKDTVSATYAECYVTIGGTRYNFMNAKKLEATLKKNKKEIPILGQSNMGTKSSSVKGEGKATFWYNNSIMREMMKKYQDTGEDFYFDITIRQWDKTSACGEQIVVLKNCNLDELVIAKFEAGGDVLEEDLSFTFESYEMPQSFNLLDGFKA